MEVRDEVQLTLDEEDDDMASISSKRSRELGPMDRFTSKNDPETSIDTRRR